MYVETCLTYSSTSIFTLLCVLFGLYRIVNQFLQSLHRDDVGLHSLNYCVDILWGCFGHADRVLVDACRKCLVLYIFHL